jgi:hypothetical protein
MTPTEPNTRPKRVRHKHGFTVALKTRFRTDLGKIDMRTEVGRRLKEWRESLIADLGGPDAVSTQQEVLVELAVKNKLLLDSLDGWLLQQDSLVNQRRRAVYPIVLQRQTVADSLARLMGQLGLERRAKPIANLADYLAGKKAVPVPKQEAK